MGDGWLKKGRNFFFVVVEGREVRGGRVKIVRPFFSGAAAGGEERTRTETGAIGNLSFAAEKIGSGLLGYPRLRTAPKVRICYQTGVSSLLRSLGKIFAWPVAGRPRFSRGGPPAASSPCSLCYAFHRRSSSFFLLHFLPTQHAKTTKGSTRPLSALH